LKTICKNWLFLSRKNSRLRNVLPVPAHLFAGQRPHAETPAPAAGEHTEAILRELGKTQAEIQALREDGVVG